MKHIVTGAGERVASRLDQFSARTQADARSAGAGGHRDSGRHEAAL